MPSFTWHRKAKATSFARIRNSCTCCAKGTGENIQDSFNKIFKQSKMPLGDTDHSAQHHVNSLQCITSCDPFSAGISSKKQWRWKPEPGFQHFSAKVQCTGVRRRNCSATRWGKSLNYLSGFIWRVKVSWPLHCKPTGPVLSSNEEYTSLLNPCQGYVYTIVIVFMRINSS